MIFFQQLYTNDKQKKSGDKPAQNFDRKVLKSRYAFWNLPVRMHEAHILTVFTVPFSTIRTF